MRNILKKGIPDKNKKGLHLNSFQQVVQMLSIQSRNSFSVNES